jgi:hypothetical protein
MSEQRQYRARKFLGEQVVTRLYNAVREVELRGCVRAQALKNFETPILCGHGHVLSTENGRRDWLGTSGAPGVDYRYGCWLSCLGLL